MFGPLAIREHSGVKFDEPGAPVIQSTFYWSVFVGGKRRLRPASITPNLPLFPTDLVIRVGVKMLK